MTEIKMSASDKSSLTLTRVMLGNPVSLGSLRSRRIIFAISSRIMLASLSVRRDISHHIDLKIHQVSLGGQADEIHQLA